MKRRLGLVLAILLAANTVAVAQQIVAPRGAPPHVVNPSLSLSPHATSPVQQQVQENYRTQLLGAQRELLQANPSGLSREQLEITHELGNYNAGPH
jgi:hypothetical protein